MNKPKKCFVLCTAQKCTKMAERTEVYKCLNKELKNNNDITLIQVPKCEGECKDGPYLNIISDYIGYSKVNTDDVRRIVEEELKTRSNPSNYINESIQQEYYHAEQWKMFSTYCIDDEPCKGCTLCKKVCPTGAISGQAKKVHIIDQSKCIKCGKCKSKCKFNAINIIPVSSGVKPLRCIKCGQLIGTVATRDYVMKKLNHLIASHALCNDCRHTYFGKVLRNKA